LNIRLHWTQRISNTEAGAGFATELAAILIASSAGADRISAAEAPDALRTAKGARDMVTPERAWLSLQANNL
jgi:hypothetical protein